MTDLNDILNLDESTLKDVLGIDPTEIYAKQYAALKAHGIQILVKITTAMENDDHNIIRECLSNSPAGDDMGVDNSFIDFKFSKDGYDDIEDFMTMLYDLKTKATKK